MRPYNKRYRAFSDFRFSPPVTIPGTTHWNGCNNKETNKTNLLTIYQLEDPSKQKKLRKGLDYGPRLVSRPVAKVLSISTDHSQQIPFCSIFFLSFQNEKKRKKLQKNMHSKTANQIPAYKEELGQTFFALIIHTVINVSSLLHSFFFSFLFLFYVSIACIKVSQTRQFLARGMRAVCN